VSFARASHFPSFAFLVLGGNSFGLLAPTWSELGGTRRHAAAVSAASGTNHGSRNVARNSNTCRKQSRPNASANASDVTAGLGAADKRHPRKVAQSVVIVGPPRRSTMLREVVAIGRSRFFYRSVCGGDGRDSHRAQPYAPRAPATAADRGTQVRTRLAAGGRWIRTLGPPNRAEAFSRLRRLTSPSLATARAAPLFSGRPAATAGRGSAVASERAHQ